MSPSLVTPGANAIGADLAGGWYTEHYGCQGGAGAFYGEQPSFAAQLEIEYEDGTSETLVTDATWRATSTVPIRSSGIYAGESYDARLAGPGWSATGFDDRGWDTAVLDPTDGPIPVARTAPPVRRTEELPVVEIITSPSGRTILDFGQNLVGWLRITVSGSAGDTVTLRHAEVLEHGELGVRPLRAARATDAYTLAGDGVETWEPAFTFHGFRYAEVDGWPGELDPGAVTAIVVHSDMVRTGWFSSSDPMIDQLHENVVWGMRGNFLSLPTDCPQRDERLGWTGDIQVFTPTASYLYDSDGFLSSWLEDLALEQQHAGTVPFVVPASLLGAAVPAAAWGDAATVVPWVLYERFADVRTLQAQYPSMVAWADELLALAGPRRLWEGAFQFGDWLDPDAPPDRPADAKTDADIVASAYLYRSTWLVAKAAAVLGRTEDARRYGDAADGVRRAWLEEYTTPVGRIVSDAQTAYALGIMFELAPDDEAAQRMGDRLAWLVRRDGYRIGTGFVGTPLVMDALSRTGHLATASRLLLQTESPSWLYPVTMGATTIWERWDSMLEDGSINPGEMTSFNHYAFGAIADWLHRVVGGLVPLDPGYGRFRIAPTPIPGLTSASTSFESPYGRASVAWNLAAGTLVVTATIPPNTTALVVLPGVEPVDVGSGEHSWSVPFALDSPAPGGVSTSTALAEVIDDPEAYEAVWQAVAEVDPRRASEFRKHTKWVDGRSLDGVLVMSPPAVVERVEAALAELSDRRSG